MAAPQISMTEAKDLFIVDRALYFTLRAIMHPAIRSIAVTAAETKKIFIISISSVTNLYRKRSVSPEVYDKTYGAHATIFFFIIFLFFIELFTGFNLDRVKSLPINSHYRGY